MNLTAGRPATATSALAWPLQVTDGDPWADSGADNSGEYTYTTAQGLQAVVIDLGAAYSVDQVQMWHYAGDGRTYHTTKTEVSADGQTWETVYDSALSGEYPETAEGKVISFSARPVRYVRDWLNGSTANAGNHWVEIQVWGQVGRAFVGEYLEWSGGESVPRYYAGSRLIGPRAGGAVSFVLSDHLGSPSTLVGVGGELQASRRYTAWGETRLASGASGLGVGYTGQEQAIGLGGLHDYGARWFDPSIMQFQQPDTLTPDPYHPLDWNRYAYARYNPIRYTDPTGHYVASNDGGSGTCRNSVDCVYPDYHEKSGEFILHTKKEESSSVISYSSRQGFCINAGNIGCSGGTEYQKWWSERYFPRMGDYLVEDLATIAQFGADPLNLGLDAYETWHGIPLPKTYGYGVDFALQLLKDSNRQDLTTAQKFGRAVVIGGEGLGISMASSAVGGVVGGTALTLSMQPAVATGHLWLPPVAYWSGYVSSYLAVNYGLGGIASQFNQYIIYPTFNLGTP